MIRKGDDVLSLLITDVLACRRVCSRLEIRRFGRGRLIQAELFTPIAMGEKKYTEYAGRLLAEIKEMGGDEIVCPPSLDILARRAGLRPADGLRGRRAVAVEAAADLLGRCDGGYGRVYARMASRDVCQCLEGLAERCRYVSPSGGDWASSMRKRLLREYGTASPPDGFGHPRLAIVFDEGFEYNGEDAVFDLTSRGIDCPRAVKPAIIPARHMDGLPTQGFYNLDILLAAAYVRGMVDREDIRGCCPVFLDRQHFI